jgi:ankyrin repeat protein
MVAANDLEGVKRVLRKMLKHEKSDGFTIQDVAGNGLLQIAAQKDFAEMTKLLLDNGFDINYVDDNHGTALQMAIYMDSEKVLEVLLNKSRKINVNIVGGYYGCALQVAAFKGSLDYINQLLELGVQKDEYIAKSKYGTALQAAARTGMCSVLERILSLKPTEDEINQKGGAWGTALQAAAKCDYTADMNKLRQLSRGKVLSKANDIDRVKKGTETADYLKVAKMLLDAKAKVNVPESGRLKNPVNAAASSGQVKMLQLLLEKDVVSEEERKERYGRALLSAITQLFNPKDRILLVKELVGRGANVKFIAGNCLHNTPLAAAAANNDEEVVKYLLGRFESEVAKKDFMDAQSGIYGSALRAALSAPQPAKETALHLIRAKADTKNGDELFGNNLHLAAFANLPEAVELLLAEEDEKCKISVNTLDKNDQTALHIAAYRGYEQVVKILLHKGADANLKDVWGDVPLDIVGDVIGRESHPVPSLQGLRNIREMLLKKSVCKDEQQASRPFPGPILAKRPQTPEQDRHKAKPVFESPKWNPGLKFHAKIINVLERNKQEYVLVKDLAIDDLLYKDGALEETMADVDEDYKLTLRWIHLPTNNVRYALHPACRIC